MIRKLLSLFILTTSLCNAQDFMQGPLKPIPVYPPTYFDTEVKDLKISYNINRWGEWGQHDLRIITKIPELNLTSYATSTVKVSSGTINISSLNLKKDFKVNITLKDKDKTIDFKSFQYKYVPTKFRSTYDSEGFLLVDGRRFFPFGFYMAGHDDDVNLKLISDAGFNFLISYQWGTWGFDGNKFVVDNIFQFLNRANKYNLKVAINMMDLFKFSVSYHCKNQPTHCNGTESDYKFVDYFLIEVAKKYPNVIMLYINDEQNQAEKMPKLYESFQYIKSKYPNVLIWQTMLLDSNQPKENNVRFLKNFTISSDVLAVDPYPIGFERLPISHTAIEVDHLRFAQEGKPWMIVNQLHGGKNYFGCCQDPTPLQQRNMMLQSIISGAKGVVLYSHFDLWTDKPHKIDDQGVFNSRWGSISQIGKDITYLKDVILFGKTLHLDLNNDVRVRTVEYKSKLYVLFVNTSLNKIRINIHVGSYDTIIKRVINKFNLIELQNNHLSLEIESEDNGYFVLER